MGNKTQKLSNVVDQIVEWQTVVTADGSTGLTAVAGRGYFIDTTSGAITVTLPASPKIGDTITIADYASTFNTNNVTINPNGNKIEASTINGVLSTNDQTHTLVYTDSTQGWKIINQDTASGIQPQFISATGGTVTTSGDYKIHTFTGDGCFVVSQVGNPLIPSAARDTVDYLVVAGGGGGGHYAGAGGGAGGYRESHSTCVSGPYTASPLATPTGITVSTTTYPITVGGGGASTPNASPSPNNGVSGSNSIFSTITSAGGGGGGGGITSQNGLSGGSGGGGAGYTLPTNGTGGSGNTPPTNPSQGNNGYPSYPFAPGGYGYTGGGGGAGAAATDMDGGAGSGTQINPAVGESGPSCLQYFAGGGGGYTVGVGGIGGGGDINNGGTANTGGGSGGDANGQNGGKGIVIIRYKFQ